MNIEFHLIPILLPFSYQPSHSFYILRSHPHVYSIHNYIYSMPFSYFILKIYKSINQTIHNNQGKKTVRPTTDLAQARSPHSGERSPLAQATDPRLGEIATEALGGFLHAHLGEPSSSGLQLQRHTLSSHAFSLRRASLA